MSVYFTSRTCHDGSLPWKPPSSSISLHSFVNKLMKKTDQSHFFVIKLYPGRQTKSCLDQKISSLSVDYVHRTNSRKQSPPQVRCGGYTKPLLPWQRHVVIKIVEHSSTIFIPVHDCNYQAEKSIIVRFRP